MSHTKLTPKNVDRFTEEIAKSGNITKACRLMGVHRRTVYRWREDNPGFAEQWDDAMAEYIEKLEEEADRRAVEGAHHKTYFDRDGNPVGEEVRYSDTLLIFRLKALKPAMYRDPPQSVEHKGTIEVHHRLIDSLDTAIEAAYARIDDPNRD